MFDSSGGSAVGGIRISTRSTARSAQLRWAAHRDWPDGTYALTRTRNTEADAVRRIQNDHKCLGPVCLRLLVVCITAHDFELRGRHRRYCKAPDWPQEGTASALAVTQ